MAHLPPVARPGRFDRRRRVPPHAQEPQRLPRRLQGPSVGRARDRPDHRRLPHAGQRRRRPQRGGAVGGGGAGSGGLADSAYGGGRPGPPCGRGPHPDHQAHPAGAGGSRRLHQGRLRRSTPRRAPSLAPPDTAWPSPASGKRATFGWPSGPLPVRARCTTAKDGRQCKLHPHEDELHAARRRAEEPDFQANYRRWRPMVERSISWLVAETTAGFVTGACAATNSVCRCGWRRSTCAGWSPGLDHDGTGWVMA